MKKGIDPMGASVSLITCTRNSATYLEQMLESVITQNLTPIEHIFVDGESRDGTLELIAAYRKRADYKVFVIKSPPRGISNAMNVGALAATGEFLMHLHSDDLFYDRNSLEAATIALKSENVSWLTGKCEYIDSIGNHVGEGPDVRYSRAKLLKSNFVSHPSTLLRRQVFNEFKGFDESLRFAMDYDFWLRLSQSETLVKLPDFISKFRIHDLGQSSANTREMREEDLFVRLRYTEGQLKRFRAHIRFRIVNFLSNHVKIRTLFIWTKGLIKSTR